MPDQHTTRTKREAARHFGVSTRTIERRLAAGQLASTIVHGPHGPEVRVVLPATGADGAAPDAPPGGDGGGAGAGGLVAAVTRVAAPPAAPPPPDTALLLAALAEANRERQALVVHWAQQRVTLAPLDTAEGVSEPEQEVAMVKRTTPPRTPAPPASTWVDRHPAARRERQPYQKAPIPDGLRWSVWERDNFTCADCGTRRNLSIDHIVTESRGGTLDPDNLQTLCRRCNSRKGARSGQTGESDQAVTTLRAIVMEQQRRLVAAAEERGRLLAQLESLVATVKEATVEERVRLRAQVEQLATAVEERARLLDQLESRAQKPPARPGASWRFWQRLTRRGDDGTR